MAINVPLVATTTSNKRDLLEQISNELLEGRMAACCQISGPVTSIYRWQGKIESSEEFVCTIKTTSQRFEEVRSLMAKLHNYDEPELVATEISHGSDSYLQWILAACESSPQ